MLLLAFKSLFFVAAIMAYSTGVWRLINDYFRQEFRTFLDEEVKKNKYLLADPDQSSSPPAEIISESEVRKVQDSVTANRLLDQMILTFGRLFTSRNEADRTRRHTSAQPPTNTIITPTSAGEPAFTEPVVVMDRIGSSADPGDPRGGGTVIESDKFSRSSSSEQEDNKSDGSDDDNANDDHGDGEEEEKWIRYWKNRVERGQLSLAVADGDGNAEGHHCEAKVVDACGP